MVTVARKAVQILPVAALTKQVVVLDAAMLVAAASAEVGAVHKLRTATRRVQAQMMLLDALNGANGLGLPPHGDEIAAVAKRLRVVRRAAGQVRDLDVQSGIIRFDTPAKTEIHAGTPGDSMRKAAKQLRKHLQRERKDKAAKLMAALRKEKEALAGSLLALETVCKPANNKAVAQAVMVRSIERVFAQSTRLAVRVRAKAGEPYKDALRRAVQRLSEDTLHTVRKTAKLCRYMAESGPEGGSLSALARRFEALQEAGGVWHDWLLLERLSRRFHGKNALLTNRYCKHCSAALEDYHLKLVELLPMVQSDAAH